MMAQPPNPQVVPFVGQGGHITREWLRYLQHLITAATTGDTQAMAAQLGLLSAELAAVAAEQTSTTAELATVTADVDTLADAVAALDDAPPALSTDPSIDALALAVGTLPAVDPLPVSGPLLEQTAPSVVEWHSLLTELSKRVTALEQGTTI